METIFCVDIGTTSLKAALIEKNGDVVCFEKIDFERFDLQKNSELAEIWFLVFEKVAKNFGENLKSVKGICISGNGPTLVGKNGKTLLWNEKVPPEFDYGKIDTKSLYIPRILAFKNMFPKIWAESKKIISGPEYLIYQLCGNAVSILPEKRFEMAYWNSNELEKFGIETEKLPDFVEPGFYCGELSENIAQRLGFFKKVPIFAGAPDFVVALIGTRTVKLGKMCDRAGSSEGINLCLEKPVNVPEVRSLPSVITGLWNASVLMPESGTLISKLKIDFEKKLQKKLTFDEFFEKVLNEKNSVEFEELKNLAEKTKNAIEILKNVSGLKIENVTITGGQAKSKKWVQFKSEICGKNFEVGKISDSELTGDAILGFYGLKYFNSIQEAAENLR